MPQKTIRQALNEALAQEMRRDPTIIVIGEDVAGGAGSEGQRDAYGGVLGVTKGLFHKFPGRVLDTPLSEGGFIGAAVGAADGYRLLHFFLVSFVALGNGQAEFLEDFGLGVFETGAVEAEFADSLLVGDVGVLGLGFLAVATENFPFDAAEVVELDFFMTGLGFPGCAQAGAVAIVFFRVFVFEEDGFSGVETVLKGVLG